MSYSIKLRIRPELGQDKRGETPIYLQYIQLRQRIFIGTKQRINPLFWDNTLGRPKRNHPNYMALLTFLSAKLEQIELLIDKYKKEHDKYPSPAKLRAIIQKSETKHTPKIKNKDKLSELWVNYIDDQKAKKVKPATLDIYHQTWDKWSVFSKKKGEDYTYLDIRFELLDQFRAYLLNQGTQKNTRGKAIKTMKAFFNYLLLTKELPINPSFKRVSVEKEVLDICTLTLGELEALKREVLFSTYPGFTTPHFNLNTDDKLIGQIMVFLCSTGLSFVDFDKLRLKHLIFDKKEGVPVDLRIELVRTKVDTAKCIIPVLGTTIDIIAHQLGVPECGNQKEWQAIDYESKVGYLYQHISTGNKYSTFNMGSRIFPSVYSVLFNRKIKQVLKTIGIDTMVSQTIFKGKEKIERLVPKYELISSITGRRTYVTLSFEQGNDATIIMKTTGHSKIETMNRYNKVSPQQIQNKFKKNTPQFSNEKGGK